jgi:hypothetical protein
MRVWNLGCQADGETVPYDGDPPAAHLKRTGTSKRTAAKYGRTNGAQGGFE